MQWHLQHDRAILPNTFETADMRKVCHYCWLVQTCAGKLSVSMLLDLTLASGCAQWRTALLSLGSDSLRQFAGTDWTCFGTCMICLSHSLLLYGFPNSEGSLTDADGRKVGRIDRKLLNNTRAALALLLGSKTATISHARDQVCWCNGEYECKITSKSKVQ